MIDGARDHLRDTAYQPIRELMPIRWSGSDANSAIQTLPKRATVTSAGKGLEALALTSGDTDSNAQLWGQLPPLQFVSPVTALPGSEVLLEAVSDFGRQPVGDHASLRSRRAFCPWPPTKLGVGDTKSRTRCINDSGISFAAGPMRVPMSVQGEFVSLDTGAASIELGQTGEDPLQPA